MILSTRVVHCRRAPYDIYIGRGRGSVWGNPFTHLADRATLARFVVASRADAIAAYARWILAQPALLAAVPTLRGKTLGCWCAPQPCHGEVLAALAELPPAALAALIRQARAGHPATAVPGFVPR
jgi:hypothetical protein